MIFSRIGANIILKLAWQKQSKEEGAIEQSGKEKWQPLNREQALAARDFSRAGEIFIDHQGQLNEVLYSLLTPLGYRVFVSAQKLQHIEKHLIASKYKTDIPHILNNPDLVTINHEEPDTHIFYKFLWK